MNKAEALFHADKGDNLPASLLEVYHSTGAVAARYPDEAWKMELPNGASTRDYLLVSFLAYRPGTQQPAIVADFILSMWRDDPFIVVKWHPNA